MDIIKKINDDYRSSLNEKDAEEQIDFIKVEMDKYGMVMKGKPFPTFLKPYFVDQKDRALFREATESIMLAIEKVSNAFFTDPKFRHLLELGDKVEEFAKIDPVYPNRQIVSRLDAFFMPETKDIKFLEFNCDSPSGMGWHDAMVDIFSDLSTIRNLGKNYSLIADKFLDTHSKMLFTKYRQFCEKKGITPEKNPLFAIVCATDSTIIKDVEIIINTLNSKGYNAIYADPRQFDYDGSKLTIEGKTVHLIYRDAIQEFLNEPYYPDTKKVLQAYRDQNICFINPFSSRVGGLKSVLAIMGDPRFSYLFNENELDAISRYIPWTRLVRDQDSDYRSKTIQLKQFILENKNNLVLKPNSGYGGAGVVIGKSSDAEEWKETLNTALTKGNNYVVQELVPIPVDDFPIMENTKLKGFETKNVNINFWAYDGVFGGAFLRASGGDIINVHRGGGLVPVFYVE